MSSVADISDDDDQQTKRNKPTANNIANSNNNNSSGSQYGSLDFVHHHNQSQSPSGIKSDELVKSKPSVAQATIVQPPPPPPSIIDASAAAAIIPPKPAVRQRTQQKQQQIKSTINKTYDSIPPATTATTIKMQPTEVKPQKSIYNDEQEKMVTQNDRIVDHESPVVNKSFNEGDEKEGSGNLTSSAKGLNSLSLLTLPTNTTTTTTTTTTTKDKINNLESELPERPYPKKVLFIVANEFCERFSYYGLRTVLVLYFHSVLGFSEAKSTVSFHLFATLCYLTPILGAILGDSVWGKFKTIFYLSIVYFIGEFVLVISSIFWDFGNFSTSATFLGLFLIGIGTGGIKPCVSALGGDQFLANEEKRRQTFFSLFYGAINLGSLISMFLTPLLRSDYHCVQRNDCYPYAFGLPCILMFVSIVVFLIAKNQYHIVPLPEKNIIIAFCQCCWIALKRKISGANYEHHLNKTQLSTFKQVTNQYNNNNQQQISQQSLTNVSDNTSSSELSLGSSELINCYSRNNNNNLLNDTPIIESSLLSSKSNPQNNFDQKLTQRYVVNNNQQQLPVVIENRKEINQQTNKQLHWLYLASDQFDRKSIGEFRIVLGILLLFVPLPVYWCLFDQQSSLWTLQATRMDGRLFNTNLVIHPDQMSVANPLLLLSAIPIFEILIYPCLNSLNLLKKPIQRMTAGGLLAAATFVLSAMIEIRIQQFLPPTEPIQGQSNLILVNGLSECSLVTPMISYVHESSLINNNTTNTPLKQPINQFGGNMTAKFMNDDIVEPLGFKSVDILSSSTDGSGIILSDNFKLKFKLSDAAASLSNQLEQQQQQQQVSGTNNLMTTTSSSKLRGVGCPFDPNLNHELNIGPPPPNKSVKLLYLEQGNGKIGFRLFNESLELPQPGKARVRLLYEFFGSSSQAKKRQFYLIRLDKRKLSSSVNSTTTTTTAAAAANSTSKLEFKTLIIDGQVLVSNYLDVDVPENGDRFVLRASDNLIGPKNQHTIILEPGTRNLLLAHQKDAQNLEIKNQLLQDNNYRISLLYQLGPYLLISISEVMFSITGLEFSYSMAPDNMKSVILGAWSLTTAFGNILTVAVESMHLFSNIVNDFLFYAAIMALDMVLFAFIGYYYKPENNNNNNRMVAPVTDTPIAPSDMVVTTANNEKTTKR